MLLAPLLTLLMGSLVLAAPAHDLELRDHFELEPRAAVPVIGDLKCKELAGGALDKRVCRTMGFAKPKLNDCASGPSNYWIKDNILKAKKGAYGEFQSGNCGMSVYNRGNKQFQISSALLFNFWSAAANACLGNDSKFDSAVCTMEDPRFGKVVVIMSAKDTNSEVLDKLLSVPKAGLE